MQGIPWRAVTLGSLLLIAICSKAGQEAQSPQPEKSKPPVKMEQRGRILGIGGIFFKSANRDQMREWYSKHLGLAGKGGEVMLPWREHDDPQKEHVTVWTVFPASTKYFDPVTVPAAPQNVNLAMASPGTAERPYLKQIPKQNARGCRLCFHEPVPETRSDVSVFSLILRLSSPLLAILARETL